MTPSRERIEATLARITPLDGTAADQARQRQALLTKPAGALGVLEDVSIQLAGMAGSCPPPAPQRPAVAVFAGDHGVLAQGVSPWPAEVTLSMVENFRAGGAAVNVLARSCGATVRVIDVGVAGDVASDATVTSRKVRRGTADLSQGPAMTIDEAEQAIAIGIETAEELIGAGHDILLTGDMGIGNTTPSACLLAALTGTAAEVVTGRGTGIDDETLALKTRVVADAVARLAADADPVTVLAEVGGLEHAGLVGLLLGAAAHRVPVILDGVIAGSAALVAQAFAPDAIAFCLAGHRSVEPGHRTALAQLGLRPLVDLDLRLGEGSGAVLAFPLVRSAALVLDEMATFDSAGVAKKG
ncbi:nicotinate-nucleotide--dimethylbenzimidazole phosphoribosyltransferase [Nocardioides sp. AE5]|uniref:nicotinate-nucleotide--dimethylbenzimidazole phosphoribosyltransferase n=1 Tax=Nocardioides sp. AE5 TaxID=2962573 RepID=UPI0028824096|nr:nicotinate-nucleotide--dimethylbenzimidazole phosphoribosyltransferase [Nocardioides sp. AE5]MDT0203593.1 nicotinate-nucleotide--dimethylbenzimidazole phosphoribosyltransferase [Nocardioides sp. AE5]